MASPSRFPLSMLDPRLLELPDIAPGPSTTATTSTTITGPGADDNNTNINEAQGAGKQHPYHEITKRNNKCWLFQFPSEILDRIIQYVIGDREAIWPIQAAACSNKFYATDSSEARMFPWPGMMFNHLLRSCWTLYNTTDDKYFYGLHDFHFNNAKQLHSFLASLTPSRRQAVKHITIVTVEGDPASDPVDPMCSEIVTPHVLTLLSQCKLKTLTVQFGIANQFRDDLVSNILHLPLFAPSTKPCLWSLSGARAALHFQGTGVLPLYHEPWTAAEQASAGAVLVRFPDMGSDDQKATLQGYRDAHAHARHQQTDASTVSEARLCAALAASRVDFPGELRIAQRGDAEGRYGYLGGGPGRRTRARTRALAARRVTALNTVPRRAGAYHHSPVRVRGLRWVGAEDAEDEGQRAIEVLTHDKYCGNWFPGSLCGGDCAPEWVGVECVNDWLTYVSLLDHLQLVYSPYDVRQLCLDDARRALRVRETQPAPLDVMDALLPTLMYDMETRHRVPRGIYQRKFRALQARHETRVRRIREHIARLEAQQARELREVVRRAKKAAKEAAKLARAAAAAKRKAAASSSGSGSGGGGGGRKRKRDSAAEDADNIDTNMNKGQPKLKKLNRSTRNQ
ncbi:hypothetical protein F4775DRAFT_602065 [Biscogniauxia sp. FL1348]|nr:hypothetical protein F4775DRAFT_602065 [Biscogniauxia sp. FL1348]